MKKTKNKKAITEDTPSSVPVMGVPETAAEQINKYGTYEIQSTSDSDNKYPEIAQGLPKKRNKKSKSESFIKK